MVESLQDLNRLCQKPRYKEVGNWMVRHVLRDLALPITWLLLHTNISANQVTLISLLVGLAGIFLFALPLKGFFLVGALLLQLWYLLDHVDGQIARYRKTACLTGRFFDFLTHHLIHGVIFFSLGWYAFIKTGQSSFLLWGFLTSLSVTTFNLIHDTKYKTFFERILSFEAVKVLHAGQKEKDRIRAGEWRRQIFSFLHKSCEIHVLMNLLTLGALAEFFQWVPFDPRFIFLIFYGVTVPLIAFVKMGYIIVRREIDKEFMETLQPFETSRHPE